MRFIIRSSDYGARIPAADVEAKKLAVRKKILDSGFQYLEYQAHLGSFDLSGHEIQEQVTVIESVTGESYV
jgi:hypothetical protein